jgi:hypothetical protein
MHAACLQLPIAASWYRFIFSSLLDYSTLVLVFIEPSFGINRLSACFSLRAPDVGRIYLQAESLRLFVSNINILERTEITPFALLCISIATPLARGSLQVFISKISN